MAQIEKVGVWKYDGQLYETELEALQALATHQLASIGITGPMRETIINNWANLKAIMNGTFGLAEPAPGRHEG